MKLSGIKSWLKQKTSKFGRNLATLTMLGSLLSFTMLPSVSAFAATTPGSGGGSGSSVTPDVIVNGGKDCSKNSVINCGATSSQQLIAKYNDTAGYPGVHEIYAYPKFNITAADIAAMNTTAVAGTVDKSGNVLVGTKLVATGALTAGREYIKGSTKVTYEGVTFYTRPPKVSFIPSSLAAFVVMKNGVFQFAIISSCGNPVTATPVTPPPPPPKYACTDLILSKSGTTPITVVASVHHTQSDGATYRDVTYTFKDATTGSSVKESWGDSNVHYTFSTYGRKIVLATVNFVVKGNVVTNTNASCEKSITFAKPSTPQYACTNLTVTPDTNQTNAVIVSSTSSNSGGAIFENVTYDFGDASTPVVITTQDNTTSTYTYATYGTYVITATYTFNVNGSPVTVTSPNCSQSITFTPPQTPMCTIPGLEQYPANSPYCSVITPPTPLVNTGPGTLLSYLAIVFGITALAGTVHYFYIKRRLAKQDIL